MRNVFLFDLDSTLLQMNQDLFLHDYFKLIYLRSKNLGYDDNFMKVFQYAAYNILSNNGSMTNEEYFWKTIAEFGYNVEKLKAEFDDFYNNEFKSIEKIVDKNSVPNDIIKYLKSKGYTIILATNPLFPKVATYERMRWAGLDINDFLDITTYENCHYSKPRKAYFFELLSKHNINPNDCIMVGNDMDDDFSDLLEGIEKILITDYLINKNNKEITIKSFTLNEFFGYIKKHF